MQTNQLTDDAPRSLSEVDADEPVVVSLFLDLDPARFAIAPARDTQITSLLSELDALIDDDGRSRDAVQALRSDRERIEAFLRDDDLDVSEAAALAIYSAQALDVFAAIKLPNPVESAVHIDQWPLLEPVMGLQDAGDWCVLLVTRESTRTSRGVPSPIRQAPALRSAVTNPPTA